MKHEEFSPNVSDFWCVLWERGIEDRNAGGRRGREGVQFRYLDGSVGSIKNEKEQPEERD